MDFHFGNLSCHLVPLKGLELCSVRSLLVFGDLWSFSEISVAFHFVDLSCHLKVIQTGD